MREIVRHAATGLVARTAADDLAGCVLRLLGDDDLRRRMGEQARVTTTQRFGAQRLVADMRDIYTSIAVEGGWWTPEHAERTYVDEGGGDRGGRLHRGEPVSGAGAAASR